MLNVSSIITKSLGRLITNLQLHALNLVPVPVFIILRHASHDLLCLYHHDQHSRRRYSTHASQYSTRTNCRALRTNNKQYLMLHLALFLVVSIHTGEINGQTRGQATTERHPFFSQTSTTTHYNNMQMNGGELTNRGSNIL